MNQIIQKTNMQKFLKYLLYFPKSLMPIKGKNVRSILVYLQSYMIFRNQKRRLKMLRFQIFYLFLLFFLNSCQHKQSIYIYIYIQIKIKIYTIMDTFELYVKGMRKSSQDFCSIYNSFSFLGWFHRSYYCKILEIGQIKEGKILVYDAEFQNLTTKSKIRLVLFEEKSKKLDPKETKEQVKYEKVYYIKSLNPDQKIQFDATNKLIVIFFYKGTQLSILINDQNRFIKANLSFTTELDNCELQSDPDKGILEYYYIQPENIKTKVFKEQHLNLALQGGGAKGVAYVGVIQALEQIYKNNIPIGSVIGSSAGGILALAISAKINSSFIKDKILPKLGSIPSKDKTLFSYQESKKVVQEYISIIKTFLNKFGIIEGSLFNYVADSITQELVSTAIAYFLAKRGFEGIQELFTYADKPDKYINIRGLLEAKLMTGSQIKSLAKDVLVQYFKKNNLYLNGGKATQAQLRQKAQTFSMREYYETNGVQFTCTSVDIKDRILRFFNHKTTPDLPVCMAVQMTGSFPVAFQSQKWKKQWGKYYIQYDNIRRQIDLQGHNFTDGGMLSNFPIKYLDNEYIRSKYFSHKTDKQNTRIFGFGLNYIDTPTLVDKNINQKYNKMAREIQRCFKVSIGLIQNFSIWKFLTSPRFLIFLAEAGLKKWWNGFTPGKEYDLSKIPVFRFLIQLLVTFRFADDNLTMQCFAKQIYFFSQSSRYEIQKRKEQNETVMKSKVEYLKSSISSIVKFYQNNQNYSFENQIRILKQLANDQTKSILELQKQIKKLIYRHEQFCFLNNQQLLKDFRLEIYEEETLVNKPVVYFNNQYSTSGRKTLVNIINRIIDFMLKNSKTFNQLYEADNKRVANRLDQIQKLIDSNKNIHKFTEKEEENKVTLEQISLQVGQTYQDVRYNSQLTEKMEKFITNDKKILEIQSQIKFTQDEKKINRYIIQNYYMQLKNQGLQDQKNLAIHVVLQGNTKFNKKYYYSYEKLIEKLYRLTFTEDKNLSIGAISTTLGSSYLAFLLCLRLPEKEIVKEITGIFNIYQFYDDIEEKLKDGKCFTIPQIDIKTFLDIIWGERNQTDIFKDLQNYTNQPKGQNSPFNRIQNNTQDQKEAVIEGFEKMLKYIIEQKIQLINKPEKVQIQEINKKFSINSMKKINQNLNDDTCKVLKQIVDKFNDQINYLMFESPEKIFFQNIYNYISDKSKQVQNQVWKQLLISRFMKTYKIKGKVQNLLLKYKLPKDLTLKELYENSKNNILFTVISINTKQSRLSFINKNTYPYMPAWAALVIAITRLIYSKPKNNRIEWTRSIPIDEKQRMATQNFNLESDQIPPAFASSYLQSTINLQYLTNNKIVSKFFKRNNVEQKYVYMTFGYNEDQKVQSKQLIPSNKQKKYDFPNVKLLMNIRSNLGNIMRIQPIQQKLNILSIYMNSHDNLIHHIYSKELLRIPVTINTLAFQKLIDNDKQINDIVEQCKYYTLQRFNFEFVSNRKCFDTYLKIYKQDQPKSNDQLKFYFLSKQANVKQYDHFYRIQHKVGQPIPNQDKYNNIPQDYKITAKKNLPVYFRFEFVGQNSITSRQIAVNFNPPNNFKSMILRLNINYPQQTLFQVINGQSIQIKQNLKMQRIIRLKTQMWNKMFLNYPTAKNPIYCRQIHCNQKFITSQNAPEFPQLFLVNKKIHPQYKCQFLVFCRHLKMMRFFACAKNHIVCLPCMKFEVISYINQRLKCYKNHQLQPNRGENVRLCDFCHKVQGISYRDDKCDVDMCERCTINYMKI